MLPLNTLPTRGHKKTVPSARVQTNELHRHKNMYSQIEIIRINILNFSSKYFLKDLLQIYIYIIFINLKVGEVA